MPSNYKEYMEQAKILRQQEIVRIRMLMSLFGITHDQLIDREVSSAEPSLLNQVKLVDGLKPINNPVMVDFELRQLQNEKNAADNRQCFYVPETLLENKSKRGKPKGTPMSEETKTKMSLDRKGRIHTEEAKMKISLGNKGKKKIHTDNFLTNGSERSFSSHTKETRLKMSLGMKGKKRSAESIEKQKATMKARISKGAGKYQPVIIDNIEYSSFIAASLALQLPTGTISFRCKSASPKFKNWKLLPFPNAVKLRLVA